MSTKTGKRRLCPESKAVLLQFDYWCKKKLEAIANGTYYLDHDTDRELRALHEEMAKRDREGRWTEGA